MDDLGAVVAMLGGFLFFVIALCVVFYVLNALAYQKMLRYFNYDKVWMAWVPVVFFQWYAMAEVTGRDEVNLGFKVPMNVFKWWWAIVIGLTFIPFIGSIAALVVEISCLGWSYSTIYSMLDGDYDNTSNVLGWLSVFIGIIPVIKFLTIRVDSN